MAASLSGNLPSAVQHGKVCKPGLPGGNSMSHYYFAYGSNMNPRRMAHRGMRYRRSLSSALPGWSLVFNKRARGKQGVAYANITERSGGCVEGVLYELVDTREIHRMDPFEGAPVLYQRHCMAVDSEQGPLEAWVYIATPAWREDGLLPERSYLNHLLAGRPWLSETYFRSLRQVEALPGV
jgi:gamma-glutamylcyclotransferase